MVETLVQAISLSLEHACIPDVTTPSEVLSALFTSLDRMLHAMQDLEAAEDTAFNRKQVGKVLQDMLLEYGSILN